METSDVRYVFLLDLFPLIEEVVQANPVLGDALQRSGLSLLQNDAQVPHLEVLLCLARDLGYASDDVVQYLLRQVVRIRTR